MGIENGPRIEDSSERDRQMMGLGSETKTEEDDDKEEDWRSKPISEPMGPQQGLTRKGRFGNLEMTPPGLTGEELEKWKKEQAEKDKEAEERLQKEREQREIDESGSSKYF